MSLEGKFQYTERADLYSHVQFRLAVHFARRVGDQLALIPGLLANTLTGRILTTTSPVGRTLWTTSIQPPARPLSTPCHPSGLTPGYAQNLWIHA